MRILALLSILIAVGNSSLSSGEAHVVGTVCNVLKFGAVGDGITEDTRSIQSAIDQCPDRGTVLLPGRHTFLTGMIRLKSHMTLQIEPGARLKGSRNDSDYRDLFPSTENTQLSNCRRALVFAENVDDITIDGGGPSGSGDRGIIDGSGDNNPDWNGPERTRPMAIFIVLSRHVTIQNLQVLNAGMWSVVNFENTDVTIDHLKVDSRSGATRDGIDIVDSSNVLIQNSEVNSEDDAICLKTGSAKGVHNVTVRNSIVSNSGVANALKLGTASTGSFENILFENIQIRAAKQAAMAVESVDGAFVKDVVFRNITFKNVGMPIFIILGQRLKSPRVGSIDSVSFEGISGTTNLNWGSAISGSVVDGVAYRLTNIHLTNVAITNTNLEDLKGAPAAPGEYEGQYPDPRMWSTLPAYGLFLRHIQGLSMTNVTVNGVASDPRRPIVAQDVSN